MLEWCWLMKTPSWISARGAYIPWVFIGSMVLWLKCFVTSAKQMWENHIGQVLHVKPASSSHPCLRADPKPALGWATWITQQVSRSAPCPSRLPCTHQPQAVLLINGLTVNGGNVHLVGSTKERHQKLNRCWCLVENLYNINFRDDSAEISYLEGRWGMPPFNYYS